METASVIGDAGRRSDERDGRLLLSRFFDFTEFRRL